MSVQNERTTLAPPLIGALLRVPWEAVNARMLSGLHQRGFDDLAAAHLVVMRHPGPENLRPSELALRTGMSRQALNYLLGQMEGLGYLVRVQEDEDGDGRGRRVHLTQRGWDAGRAMREIVREVEAEWSRKLGSERLADLRGLLADLSR